MLDKGLEHAVHIRAGSVTIEGMLALPEGTASAVAFAHGSGSSRHSVRNRFVANVLNEAGIGTLLFDLLTAEEDTVYENRFDIALLTERLKAATRWLMESPPSAGLRLGYFGASTGAAAALWAAADLGDAVGAVVSRGGRPDLAMEALERLKAPTLLIVGSLDEIVLDLNQTAYELIRAEKDLKIIPGATHLFEEPGTLDEVARHATEWFLKYLVDS